MSCIETLRIDGIRSFCHMRPQSNKDEMEINRKRAESEQQIRFGKPLTLIWGHNGSGKTV